MILSDLEALNKRKERQDDDCQLPVTRFIISGACI